MLSGYGGVAGFAAHMDKRFNCPPGCFQKLFNMADDYDRTLHLLMIQHPEASRSDLRHTILPPVVERIYKDWSPQKQEYLVWSGVKTWLGENSWEGLGENCTKNVNKQGFMSGPGDRALFGWTVKQGDQYSSRRERVYWTEDEEEEKERKGKGKGKKKTKTTRKRKVTATAKEKVLPNKKADAPKKR